MQPFDSFAEFIDQLQCLGTDNAIEHPLWKNAWRRDIPGHCNLGIFAIDVQHVLVRDAASEATTIRIVADLENASFDVCGTILQKALDVVTVHGRAAIPAEIHANWQCTRERTEI